MGKYSHRFHRKPAKFNKLLLHDLGNRDHQKNYADVRRKPLEFQVGGTVAYSLELPNQLSRVHRTFHVFNLKKCYADKPLAIPLDEIHIDDKLNFIKEPVEIMDREVKRLKQICIPVVKPVQGPNTNGTDEDIVKSTKKPTPTVIVKRPVPIKGCVLGLANVKTWDSIVKKFGVRKPGSCADKTKGKRKLSGVVLLLEPRCLLDNLCGSWLLCAFDNVLVRLPLDVGLVKTAQTRSFTTPRLLYYSLQCCNR
ncbi:hypothetical protein Tco_0727603 [Tanacetum coccineum]|uniref:Tf2-1-like SH3-like domain-containing protein n=1 Tax=Tanacetum coccineum TaxID=301880 RepID=A0ABQ4YLA5_9ASTR